MTLKSFDNPNSDAARQFLLDRRSERPHPKRHRTLGRAKRMAKAKRQRVRARLDALKKERGQYLEAARAYWSGLSDGHP